jgi:hypothetical protein
MVLSFVFEKNPACWVGKGKESLELNEVVERTPESLFSNKNKANPKWVFFS